MKTKLYFCMVVMLLAAACGRGITSHERMLDGMEGKLTFAQAKAKWGQPYSSYEYDKHIIAKWYMDPIVTALEDCENTWTYICIRATQQPLI